MSSGAFPVIWSQQCHQAKLAALRDIIIPLTAENTEPAGKVFSCLESVYFQLCILNISLKLLIFQETYTRRQQQRCLFSEYHVFCMVVQPVTAIYFQYWTGSQVINGYLLGSDSKPQNLTLSACLLTTKLIIEWNQLPTDKRKDASSCSAWCQCQWHLMFSLMDTQVIFIGKPLNTRQHSTSSLIIP